ncbi:deubiquitinating enzyme MINDY-3/4 [Babesia gibsoni]|uniref:Deubiquitinating enzyme MINDY-3/4 n=1 Tax=Babesia gibsoni TaxID=33632 RepID=A0AAD8UWQ0_BABGI|nr:deubiquitinating enzyme MINDY-3/4 [Babesia gibsoni]
MGHSGSARQLAEESGEHDEALKLALKLSMEEYKGSIMRMNGYEKQKSGFFNSLIEYADNQGEYSKAQGDVVSMEYIINEMQRYHKVIKNEVNQAAIMNNSNEVDGLDNLQKHSLSRNMLTDLVKLLFGNDEKRDAEPDEIALWCKQGFRFHEDPNLFWGLSQSYVGPCGVLATVQSYMLHCLLFNHEIYGSMEHMLEEEPADAVLMRLRTLYFNFITVNHPDFPQEWLHIPSLLEAICALIYNATPSSKYTILLFEPLRKSTAGNPIHSIIYSSKYIHREFNNIADVASHLLKNLHLLMCEMGVVSFTLSLLATRGIANVQNDMDDPNQPLVGAHGHSTQELVNLMLHGKAVSNVFDGEKVINGNDTFTMFKLKGITKEVNIGFLTEQEARRHCKVGSYLKNPKLPIWVVSSLNHYSVIFGMDITYCKRTELDIYRENALNIWSCIDQEDDKLISDKMLPSLLDMLAIPSMYNDACEKLITDSGVILQSDFMEWYLAQTTNRTFTKQADTLTLFQYNGQEKHSPLTMITVKRAEAIDKARMVGQRGDTSGVDADILGYAEGKSFHTAKIVWTRWPRTFVQAVSITNTPSTKEHSENEML